jgi:hypothetical protein
VGRPVVTDRLPNALSGVSRSRYLRRWMTVHDGRMASLEYIGSEVARGRESSVRLPLSSFAG